MTQMKKINLFLIIILAIGLAGCASGGESSGGLKNASVEISDDQDLAKDALAVTANLRFEDLPVPVGFKLIKEGSFIFQTEGARVALLKYSGWAKEQKLVEFYKAKMPIYGWRLLNAVEYGRSVLNFERGGQTCIVTIEPRGMKRVVTLAVSPKSKAGLPSEAGEQNK